MKRSVKGAASPVVEASGLADALAFNLGEAMDLLDEAGRKYFSLASDVGNMDEQIVRLFKSKWTTDKERQEMAQIISNALKKYDLGSTISSRLYDILSKYVKVDYVGRKPKYSILRD